MHVIRSGCAGLLVTQFFFRAEKKYFHPEKICFHALEIKLPGLVSLKKKAFISLLPQIMGDNYMNALIFYSKSMLFIPNLMRLHREQPLHYH